MRKRKLCVIWIWDLLYDNARFQRWLARHPIGRFGEPDEIVGIIIYLASDNSKFMTGNVIYLDGGGHAT